MYEAVDIACGPGGFSEGWALATGGADVLGVDFDAAARSSYEAAGFTAIHGDLRDTDDFVTRTLVANGGERFKCAIGSSTCIEWTRAGGPKYKRTGADGKRDTLVEWCAAAGRLAEEAAIMENVKHVLKHPHWTEALEAIGMPLVGMWTLKAYLYGAPTKRERTFWVWRRDGVYPSKPVPAPVPVKYASVISNAGGQFGARRLPENTHLYCRIDAAPGAKFRDRYTILTVEEALEAQGCPGRVVLGNARERARQIADMIPPPLAAAVIRAALRTPERSTAS